MCVLSRFSRIQLFTSQLTTAHQALLSMWFSRHEYWSGLPGFPPGDLPDWGIKSVCLTSPALAGEFFTTSATWEAHVTCIISFNPYYSVVGFVISYSFYKQGKQSWEVKLLTQDHTMNDRDEVRSRSVLTLKSVLFLLCYTASLSKYIWLCQVNDKCYIFDVYSYIYISYLILVIANKIGCDRDDYHQFIDDETFVT